VRFIVCNASDEQPEEICYESALALVVFLSYWFDYDLRSLFAVEEAVSSLSHNPAQCSARGRIFPTTRIRIELGRNPILLGANYNGRYPQKPTAHETE